MHSFLVSFLYLLHARKFVIKTWRTFAYPANEVSKSYKKGEKIRPLDLDPLFKKKNFCPKYILNDLYLHESLQKNVPSFITCISLFKPTHIGDFIK